MDLAVPHEGAPEAGGTYLSLRVPGGNVYVVDQGGLLVNGVISCSAHTEAGEITKVEMVAYSHNLNEKPQNQPDE